MEWRLKQIMHNRVLRHTAFWLAWILGFTFIKSFGEDVSIYAGWLVYYIVTLPVFVLHTYIIVYLAAPRLLKGWKWILFVLLFIGLMYLFSVAEIWITENILQPWFPGNFSENIDYHNPADVLISGIGNLYIILVFIAMRQVRVWYMADQEQQKLEKRELEVMKAKTKAGIQPTMLLFLTSEIERLAFEKSEDTSIAIARLSELLNLLMQSNDLGETRVDEELVNVKKLIGIYKTIRGEVNPRLLVEGEAVQEKLIPAFIIFTPLEIIFRKMDGPPGEPIHISVIDEGHVQIRVPLSGVAVDLSGYLRREVEQLFPGRFRVEASMDGDDFEVTITRLMGG